MHGKISYQLLVSFYSFVWRPRETLDVLTAALNAVATTQLDGLLSHLLPWSERSSPKCDPDWRYVIIVVHLLEFNLLELSVTDTFPQRQSGDLDSVPTTDIRSLTVQLIGRIWQSLLAGSRHADKEHWLRKLSRFEYSSEMLTTHEISLRFYFNRK
jgi:hypothetical protein